MISEINSFIPSYKGTYQEFFRTFIECLLYERFKLRTNLNLQRNEILISYILRIKAQ